MASNTFSSISFKVRRCEPELVAPAEPTPRELKALSDVDDQGGLRFQIPIVMLYRSNPSTKGIDPVRVIREALAKALVFYYPFAGRLRNDPKPSGNKLAVDCTAEGVLFVEGEADITLDQLGDHQAPFACFDELLYDVPGSGEITDSPILLIQVTRFSCGGFTFALRHNHTMSDAAGLIQFINAIAEMARGATSPSIIPVWQRELLNARNPPRVTCSHPEYDQSDDTKPPEIHLGEMSHRSFFFGEAEVSTIRKSIPSSGQQDCSSFELVAAYLWRCRMIALRLDPKEVVHGVVNFNVRSKFSPALPAGYYGNVFAFAVARTTAGELCRNPLGYAVGLVRNVKENVTEEYMRSMVDLIVVKGRVRFPASRPYIMSDIRHAGFGDVDFGWGLPVYGGVAGAIPGDAGFLVRFKNSHGEEGISVAVCLPKEAMERFVQLYENLRLSSSNKGFKTVNDYKSLIQSSL